MEKEKINFCPNWIMGKWKNGFPWEKWEWGDQGGKKVGIGVEWGKEVERKREQDCNISEEPPKVFRSWGVGWEGEWKTTQLEVFIRTEEEIERVEGMGI